MAQKCGAQTHPSYYCAPPPLHSQWVYMQQMESCADWAACLKAALGQWEGVVGREAVALALQEADTQLQQAQQASQAQAVSQARTQGCEEGEEGAEGQGEREAASPRKRQRVDLQQQLSPPLSQQPLQDQLQPYAPASTRTSSPSASTRVSAPGLEKSPPLLHPAVPPAAGIQHERGSSSAHPLGTAGGMPVGVRPLSRSTSALSGHSGFVMPQACSILVKEEGAGSASAAAAVRSEFCDGSRSVGDSVVGRQLVEEGGKMQQLAQQGVQQQPLQQQQAPQLPQPVPRQLAQLQLQQASPLQLPQQNAQLHLALDLEELSDLCWEELMGFDQDVDQGGDDGGCSASGDTAVLQQQQQLFNKREGLGLGHFGGELSLTAPFPLFPPGPVPARTAAQMPSVWSAQQLGSSQLCCPPACLPSFAYPPCPPPMCLPPLYYPACYPPLGYPTRPNPSS